MEYSQEEKNQLNQKLREELAKKKAQDLGVDPTDLMQRVWDGKSSWVRKSEIFVQLDKQRKLASPQGQMRSLRGGEDSLAGRITREINLCRLQMNSLEQDGVLSPAQVSDFRTSIGKLENRTISLTNQLGDVENRIEREKTRDPVFVQAEKLLMQVREARDQENPAITPEQLIAENKDMLGRYELLRKGLNPLLDEARKHRLDLQRDYWNILEIHFKLQATSIFSCKKQMAQWINEIQRSGSNSGSLLQVVEWQKTDEQITSQYYDLASHCPPSHINPLESTRIWENLLPEMESLIQQQAGLRQSFQSLRMEKPKSIEPPDGSKNRMVYAERRINK